MIEFVFCFCLFDLSFFFGGGVFYFVKQWRYDIIPSNQPIHLPKITPEFLRKKLPSPQIFIFHPNWTTESSRMNLKLLDYLRNCPLSQKARIPSEIQALCLSVACENIWVNITLPPLPYPCIWSAYKLSASFADHKIYNSKLYKLC